MGRRRFNGVAIISRVKLEDVRRGLPGDDGDEQARYLEGVLPLGDGVVRVASIYLPNGNPPNTEKYPYKLAWMARLTRPCADAAAARGAAGAGRRLQRHPRAARCARSGRLGQRRPVPAADARRLSRPDQSRADRGVPRHDRGRRASTPSGIIRPAPGSGTTASASTTCCSRRRPPTGSTGCRSSSMSAAGRSRRTMCRSMVRSEASRRHPAALRGHAAKGRSAASWMFARSARNAESRVRLSLRAVAATGCASRDLLALDQGQRRAPIGLRSRGEGCVVALDDPGLASWDRPPSRASDSHISPSAGCARHAVAATHQHVAEHGPGRAHGPSRRRASSSAPPGADRDAVPWPVHVEPGEIVLAVRVAEIGRGVVEHVEGAVGIGPRHRCP